MTTGTQENLVIGGTVWPREQVMECLEYSFDERKYRSVFLGTRLFLSEELYDDYLLPIEDQRVPLSEQLLSLSTYLAVVQRYRSRYGPTCVVTSNGWLVGDDDSPIELHLRFEPVACKDSTEGETIAFLVDEVSGGGCHVH